MPATERVEAVRPPSLKAAKARAWAAQLWALTRMLGGKFREAVRRRRGRAWLGLLAFQAGRAYQRFVRDFLSEQGEFGDLFGPRMERLRKQVEGLQLLLPPASGVTGYSVLIPVYRPQADFFKKALRAALSQGAPRMEILVGFDGPQPSAVGAALDDLRRDFPKAKVIMRVLDAPKREGISAVTNRLAAEARFSHLLFMDHDDWMRPDLLYRYDQVLRTMDPSRAVLSCDEYKINEFDEVIPGSLVTKSERPPFPYFFQNHVTHCLLVPKALFERAGRLRSECDGAQDYDLCLRLNLVGAEFQNVPFPLYAWRAHASSTALNPMQKAQVTESGVRALGDYAKAKGLDWEVREGAMPSVYRGIPRLKGEPRVHAIVPYRDEREMTVRAVKAALAQRGVRTQVTAVDNASSDPAIAEDLRKLGCEVIRVDEPFNYSRLNNQGLARSKLEATEFVLFLNNDVVMDVDCAQELARWASQSDVGAAGARLRYPDGKLQHGGIDLDPRGPADRRTWVHTECGLEEKLLARTMVIRACEAVTAACMLVPRAAFERVGGFDEVFYPIAYSDTRLCARLRAAGLHVVYTPYATGVHFEGATRGVGAVEDFESSAWLEKRVP